MIGWLYEFRSSSREQRSDDIQLAIQYFIKYLQLCRDYGLVRTIPKATDENDSDKYRLHSMEDRQAKIQKAKEKKSLEQSIKNLRQMKSDDEEIKRQLYIEQIKWWIRQAEDDIFELKDEAKLVQFAKEPIPQTNTTSHNLPINGPFTLLTTKERMYREAVRGAGYPRYFGLKILSF